MQSKKIKELAAFLGSALLWGTSFLWIKISLRELSPFLIVTYRLTFGALGTLVLMRISKQHFPRGWRSWRNLLVLAFFNPCVAFILICWGETRIDSGMAAILNGTVPLFTILISHLALHDERMSPSKVGGLLMGFLGVVILVNRSLPVDSAFSAKGALMGKLAVLGAAISYAFSAVFIRRCIRGVSPVTQTTAVMCVSAAAMWLILPFAEPDFHLPRFALTWLALSWMGLLSTAVAFAFYYYYLNAWGAIRSSLVNYLFPIIAVVLGIVFLGEKGDWRLALGSLLVFSGILIVNARAIFQLARPSSQ